MATQCPPLSSLLLLPLLFTLTNATTFNVINTCSYTVWAATVPGDGQQLDPGRSWTLNVPAGTTSARVWGRMGCSFDSSGNGHCQTGDCGGVLECTAYGSLPNTLAEYSPCVLETKTTCTTSRPDQNVISRASNIKLGDFIP
ncbi:Thaumatin-like protein [Acorus gramineus]|uniref:Thaumatin-like protein n=1 Tax=Acorus gramineus TaxID=55184 RepID=A0AAV9BSV4_ACOGR|nr:Thaumatin-like protein [Acorus gramineus]